MERKTEGVGAPTPTEKEATRRYLQGELDNAGPDDAGIIRVQFTGTKHLNITAAQLEAIKKIIVPEPESPVSHDPCVQGVIEIGGRKSEFLLPLGRPDVKYSQWGADNTVLWPRADLLEVMADAAAEWVSENLCRTCGENLLDDGEGYDGECGDCADKTEEGRDTDPEEGDTDD